MEGVLYKWTNYLSVLGPFPAHSADRRAAVVNSSQPKAACASPAESYSVTQAGVQWCDLRLPSSSNSPASAS
ncbi:pleckstrin homology domain containing A8 [Homo sapiens]|uniref:Pleckstrin homology domain containing A8 n=1 Tax=Homo sapiens TaxID=9606 RepID=A0A3B3IST3_HUMAN|nr:pleckstrin-likey domain containing A8 [Homo sapiens]KAI4013295.1 pleckstrin homology domain containing A8 [Homo sapiens]